MQSMRYPFAHSGVQTLGFLLFLACLLISDRGMAATPPGTIIRSQAEASFVDEFNEQFLVTSNEVVTEIKPVTGVRLESTQHRWGMKGERLIFPHLLINTGNIPATYRLTTLATELSDTMPRSKGYVPTTLYTDNNHDGQSKGEEEISEITLAPGENIDLLIETTVPDLGYTRVNITAEVISPKECTPDTQVSEQGRCRAENNNMMSRSKGVVYNVSMSTNKGSVTLANRNEQGDYIGESHLVETTFTFQRLDNTIGKGDSFVEMIYPLPPELEYQENSTELCPFEGNGKCWPLGGDLEPEKVPEGLKFRIEQDQQIGDPVYVPGKNDGHDGRLRFTLRAISGVGKTLYNGADYTFCYIAENDGCTDVDQTTNYVPLDIRGYGISLNASPLSSAPHIGEPQIVASAPAGSLVEFTNYLWNLGTEPAGYTVTLETAITNPFPEGSSYCLTTETECIEQDFSKYPSTAKLTFKEGDISPGTNQAIRLFVQLPGTGIPSQPSYNLSLKAVDDTAQYGFEVADSSKNMLVNITGSATNSMDLTITDPEQGILGTGKGPEATALKTFQGKPGTTLIPDDPDHYIIISNKGDQADNYQLELLSVPNGAPLTSFKWSFVNEYNRPIANSGTVPANGHTKVKVRIELPADQAPDNWSFYVRARSPVTKVEDSLHLALEIPSAPEAAQLTLTPDGRGMVSPGTFITFAHQLSNGGNQTINDITLTLDDSMGGWQSMISASDNTTDVTQPFDLAGGETLELTVKLFAPANAAQGEINITTITATFGAGANQQTIFATDTTTASNAIVTITKIQAPWDCSSTLPGDEKFSTKTFPVNPGKCVVYKLTASNQGSEPVQNVNIHDRAPNFTVFKESDDFPEYSENGEHSISGQTISVHWSEGLMPGQSVFLKFGIQVQ